jgi:hypothetical protein
MIVSVRCLCLRGLLLTQPRGETMVRIVEGKTEHGGMNTLVEVVGKARPRLIGIEFVYHRIKT